MTASNKVYVHFDKSKYISGKSELLRMQMDTLYLKKILKNLALTRTKKIHYRELFDEVMTSLREGVGKLDKLMPIDEQIKEMMDKEEIQQGKNLKKIKNRNVVNKEEPKKVDDLEEELLKIKEKLASLNI